MSKAKPERVVRPDRRVDAQGREIVDPTRVVLSMKESGRLTLQEMIARALRDTQARRVLGAAGVSEESFDEMNDFSLEAVEHATTAYERAVDALPPDEFRQKLIDAVYTKPSLVEKVRSAFSHVFGPNDRVLDEAASQGAAKQAAAKAAAGGAGDGVPAPPKEVKP